MAQRIGSDAERITAIQDLERAIHEKLPELTAARTACDAAKQVQTARRHDLKAIDQQIAAIGREIHLQSAGVYLNGGALDRGTVSLGNEVVRFSGWHGKAEIPIHTIAKVETGHSLLAPRAGVPVLGMLWPGVPRQNGTLLLTVQESDVQTAQYAVVADLENAEGWQHQIHRRQHDLDAVHVRRDDLAAQRERAVVVLQQASNMLGAAQAELSRVQSEIAELFQQSDKLRAQQHQIDAARAQGARAARQAAQRRRRK